MRRRRCGLRTPRRPSGSNSHGRVTRTLTTVGYAATTTTAVAAEAGVSRGALQYAFDDRAEVMVAVVCQGYQRMVDELRHGAAARFSARAAP